MPSPKYLAWMVGISAAVVIGFQRYAAKAGH